MSTRKVDIKPCLTDDIVVNKMVVRTSTDFEARFLNFLDRYVYEKFKVPGELEPRATTLRLGKPRIIERKICLDYDNTWRSSGEKIFIALYAPDNDRYEAKGYIEVAKFILDPSVALTFKVEFRLEMPTQDKDKKEQAFFTLAWGYFLPDFSEKGELLPGPIDCDLQLGPGTAPDGSVLWTPDKNDTHRYKLELSAELIPKTKFDPNAIETRARDTIRGDTRDSIDRLPFEDEKYLAHKTKPLYDDRSKKLEDRLNLEKKEAKYKDEKIQQLEQKVKNYSEQLYSKKAGELISPKLGAEEELIRKDERKNAEIVKQKYKNYIAEMEDKYKEKIRRLEDKFEDLAKDKSRSPSLRDRDLRPKSGGPSQLPYASNYLADPSHQHPSFYPPDDRSRLIGQSRYIDEDLKILPPAPLIPLELPTAFDLTRDDEIAFVKLGIKEEILKHDTYDQPDLDIEIRNPLQASDFVIRFIAFKPPLSMPYGQSVPRRMYFKFNFFTFPDTMTQACALKDPRGESDMIRELIPGQQYLLERVGKAKLSEFRSVEAEFSVDKSISKIHDENIQFYKYLFSRELSIDIYDADSHLHYGTCRVNLRQMLKQTRPGVVRAKN